MEKFLNLKSIPSYLPLQNIDTDMIIPKQFLKTIKRTGLGKSLFYEMRYDENGNLIKDFTLNNEPYNKSKILLAGKNFGCGSSREHAVWALKDFGIEAIISSSFADIFYRNSLKNSLLLICLSKKDIQILLADSSSTSKYELTIDIQSQTITTPSGKSFKFDINSADKERIMLGYDDIGLTLKLDEKITSYENKMKIKKPWMFEDNHEAD